MRKIIYTAAIIISFLQTRAAVELTWYATAGETKEIYSITGSYTIDWGDGTTGSTASHTYSTAGTYTASVDGTFTALDLRADGGTDATGVTAISVSEENTTMTTLYIWANTDLETLDIANATGLQYFNATACSGLSEIDLSGNTALISFDLKINTTLTSLLVADLYSNLTTVDINSTSITACCLNNLFEALPSGSGTIYTSGCTGDATSDPTIATDKGWTFSNGGEGDGSAVCVEDLDAPTNVATDNVDSDGFDISWTAATEAESYSIRIQASGTDACDAVFYYVSGTDTTVSDLVSGTEYEYTVYSIRETEFAAAETDTVTLDAGTASTLNIDLIAGWNLVSVCIIADDMTISALFPNATAVKTLEDYYYENQDAYLNTITEIEAGTGYLLYNTVAETITITGTVKTRTLSLQDGLNLVGCPYSESATFETAFGTELDNIQSIESFDGEWSATGTQTINSLEPGKAYFIIK